MDELIFALSIASLMAAISYKKGDYKWAMTFSCFFGATVILCVIELLRLH